MEKYRSSAISILFSPFSFSGAVKGLPLFYLYHSTKLTSDAFVDVSSATSVFQRLSVGDSKLEVSSSEDNPTVVLPNHLQALAADCSHLSFGTYNGGSNSASTMILASSLSKSGLEEKSAAIDGSSAQFLDTRHFLFFFKLLIYSAFSIFLLIFLLFSLD